MAYITREYDDQTILQNLRAIRPDFSLPERTRIEEIDASFPSEAGYRSVELKIVIPLSRDEFNQVFGAPTR